MTAVQEVAKSFEEPPVPIIFTDSAATKVADLLLMKISMKMTLSLKKMV